MLEFKEIIEKNMETLEKYVPVVARVHGGTHPEFHEVHKLFDAIKEKIKVGEVEELKLDNEFRELRNITINYTVPADTCETYEAVYNMLAELDQAYNK